MSRQYPDRPIVGVAAVVIEDDRVALVRRGRPPAYGEWSLPGGAVEPGESLEEAVVREVAEEIGLKVEVVEVAAVLERIFWDQEGEVQYHYVLIDFLCRKTGGKLQASSDAISCSQVPFTALAQYNLTKETRGVIDKAYQRLSGGSPPIYTVKAVTSIQS